MTSARDPDARGADARGPDASGDAAGAGPPPGWEAVPCDHCGGTKTTLLHVLGDWRLGLPGSFRLVRCRACGLAYLNPRPGPAAMGEYYAPGCSFYRPVRRGRVFAAKRRLLRAAFGAESGGVPQQTARALFHLLRDYFPGYPLTRRRGTLLDVGCGAGHFVMLLERSGLWRAAGLEPEPGMVAALRAEGLEVWPGGLEESGALAGGRRFDVVRLWHVFEHLHSPRAGLARIRELLEPGGELVLGVPALDSPAARLFGRRWAGLDAPRHLHDFTAASLRRFLEATGYRVLAIRRTDARTWFGSMQLVWNVWRERLTGRAYLGGRLFNNRALVLAYQPLELLVNWCGLGAELTVHAVRADRDGRADGVVREDRENGEDRANGEDRENGEDRAGRRP